MLLFSDLLIFVMEVKLLAHSLVACHGTCFKNESISDPKEHK